MNPNAMDTIRLCPHCQQPLAADAPSGLCPQCLLKAAAGPPPSAASVGLAGDFPDIGDPADVAKRLPQFEILEVLGRGGMGVVYKARQAHLDRIVALKILPPVDALSPDFVERFRREARSLARLNHPNIVAIHDFGEAGGLYYILMEYVDGANLRQLLQTRRLTPAEALAIVPKICDALEYAHEEGLVHRDIKPENLLLDKKGRVKIADFGLAKLLRREPLDMTLTLSGMALGTLRYMAPEQMDKPESVDHRADLYSLGVVIYEMLTGETPVGRFELPSQKAQVDARLDQIVLHALEKEPARRYQHASEVRADVENFTSKPQAAGVTQVVAGDTTRADGDKPDERRPLPRFFQLRSLAALMLGWLAVAVLWNFRFPGFLLGTVIIAAIVKQIGRTHANRNPRWVEKLHARPPWKRYSILFLGLFELVLAFMMFLCGLFVIWDRATMQESHLSPTKEQFEAQYKGKEYQLLRQLDAFKEQVPAVDLDADFIGTSAAGKMQTAMAWVFIIGGLVVLFCFFQQSAGEMTPSGRGARRGGWRAAVTCTSIFLLSLLFAGVTFLWVYIFHISGRRMTFVARTLVVPAKVNQVSNALHRWAAENGCDSADDRWSLQTVPKGERIASVEVFQAGKDSPFERWRMTPYGLQRPFPQIVAQIVSSERPAQSQITVYSVGFYGSMVDVGSAREKQWQAIIQNLVDAARKAPDFDAGMISVTKPPIQHAATESIWPGLCGVLALMVFWVFVSIRFLTPAPRAIGC